MAQKEFAKSIGLSLRAYQNYERGERPIVKEALLSIMQRHSVNPTWLLTGEESASDGVTSDSGAMKEVDLLLFNKVVAAFREKGCQLRNFRLESITSEVIGVYNSVVQCSDDDERDRVLKNQMRVINDLFLRAGMDELISDAAHFPSAEPVVRESLKEMRKELKQLQEDEDEDES